MDGFAETIREVKGRMVQYGVDGHMSLVADAIGEGDAIGDEDAMVDIDPEVVERHHEQAERCYTEVDPN